MAVRPCIVALAEAKRSGPRVDSDASRHARALRTALSDAVRSLARNQLARVVRDLADAVLAFHDVPAHARDDLSIAVAMDAVARIEAGSVGEGREEAYVRACARHRATDYYRSIRSGVFTALSVDDLDLADDGSDALALLVAREDDAARERLTRRVRRLLAAAPETYRRVIEEVYLAGTPIDVLAASDLQARAFAGEISLVEAASPQAKKRARDRIDKHLERARKWLRARLADAAEEQA